MKKKPRSSLKVFINLLGNNMKKVIMRAYLPDKKTYLDVNKFWHKYTEPKKNFAFERAFFSRLGHFKTKAIIEIDGESVEIIIQ